MTKQEQNLKFLRKLIDNLKSDVDRNRKYFVVDTAETDFGEFWNKKVSEIGKELIEMKDKLEELIFNLNSEINRLAFENKEK